MERTSIELGGVQFTSSVMNASGPHSAEKGEIYELSARHSGAIVFKSCNIAGLEAPENLKNKGVEHFASLARELSARGKVIIGSVVGNSVDELLAVARRLDQSGVKILELNLADDYVRKSVAPFGSVERLKAVIEPVRAETHAVLAVKVPPNLSLEPRKVTELFKQMRVAIAVCANDLPKDLAVDLNRGIAAGPKRTLSQASTFFQAGEGALDVVAVGGINGGRDAYIAHLTGARAVQVGSALIKEGAGALGRIDRELDGLLAENGKTVGEIVGALRFE